MSRRAVRSALSGARATAMWSWLPIGPPRRSARRRRPRARPLRLSTLDPSLTQRSPVDDSMLSLGVVLALVFIAVIVLVVFFQFIPFGLWLTALFSGVRISFFT